MSNDQENLIKSCETANLLVKDLRELVKSTNPLLAELSIEILQQSILIEQRLKRIETITRTEEKIE